MKNETLSQSYKELLAASIIVAHKVRAKEGMVAWWIRRSDTDMYRLLREHSGIEGSGFTDFSPSTLTPYFSAFIEEAIKDSKLSQLYSRKDLGPILIYQLAHHIRRVMPINIDDSYFQEIYPHLYREFESLLYEDGWVTATIYPLVNFYSEIGWQERQKHKALGLDEKRVRRRLLRPTPQGDQGLVFHQAVDPAGLCCSA